MFKLKEFSIAATVALASMTMAGSVFAAEVVVDQHNKSFEKDGQKIEKLAISAGDTIRFKNEDPFFHNIFSLSDLQTFDLGSFPKGESKTVTYDKPGIAEIENFSMNYF